MDKVTQNAEKIRWENFELKRENNLLRQTENKQQIRLQKMTTLIGAPAVEEKQFRIDKIHNDLVLA